MKILRRAGTALFVEGLLHRAGDASLLGHRRLEDEGVELAMRNVDQVVSPLCDGEARDTDETYSVIVVSDRPHRSNLFRDRARMCTYSTGVVSVLIANPDAPEPFEATPESAPFHVDHPDGASKLVRIFHTGNSKRYPNEVSILFPHVLCRCNCYHCEHFGVLLHSDWMGTDKKITTCIVNE